VKSTVSTLERPLMHVPPSLVGELQAASLLLITGPEEVSSVTGDKVIISDGYDDVTTPKVFFTGEVIVRLSNVDDEGGPLYDHRINNYSLSLNEWAAVDFAPCATVRVGV
jgi:hypothetical protein